MRTKLIIFGITGDLSRRKILPALSKIVESGQDIDIVGVSRRNVTVEELTSDYPALSGKVSLFIMDLAEPSEYVRLSDYLGKIDDSEQRLYYLSVPPGAATTIADFLGEAGLNSANEKILFEKPFGLDLISAEEFIARTSEHYSEQQIFRIDHYMAKEIARVIIDMDDRRQWSSDNVEKVEVVATETIGVEGRNEFYEQTGAIRDVVQGHLMQLLSLVLMKSPDNLKNLPKARLEALKQLKKVERDDVVTAQYDGYRLEVGAPDSITETYAKLTLYSEDERWGDVPLILETGKRMPNKQTYIKITYKNGQEDIFDESTVKFEDNRQLKDAYEHVLIAAIKGDRSIFTTSEEVLASWRVLAPLIV